MSLKKERLIALKKMKIIVTNHAINRYRERMFDYNSPVERVINILEEIVQKGKPVCNKPNTKDNCYEIKYRGISVVQIAEGDRIFVITCLGDHCYRKWVKHIEKRHIVNYVREFVALRN